MNDCPNPDNLAFAEELYARYLENPDRVPGDWRRYFEQIDGEPEAARQFRLGPSFHPPGLFGGNGKTAPPPADGDGGSAQLEPASSSEQEVELAAVQERVDQMIRNYRVRGHIIAQLDPLGRDPGHHPELDPTYVGLTEKDLDRACSTALMGGPKVQTVRQVLQRLRETYCRSVGVQFMHIHDPDVRQWLQREMESTENRLKMDRQEQLRILRRLTDAVVFEQFLQTRYIGAKTFSLEGAETLIPLMDQAIERAGEHGAREIVIGMAHRGRLNVLANIMGKKPQAIFREFDDADHQRYIGGGDVKYHLGYSGDWELSNGQSIHLSLCFNPSHLEFINPVAIGRVRAKQDRVGPGERRKGLTMLIHGDAAVAGEGIVQETLNLSQLDGYYTGGTMHVVVNNQIGFTTPSRQYTSSTYPTDVAKMLQIPIFYVNGEDPEAVAQVIRLATDFRERFQRDVIIDMYCYRRRGHNEGDEPAFTQPLLYQKIENKPSVRKAYLDHLLKMGGVHREEADRMAEQRKQQLDQALQEARREEYTPPRQMSGGGIWTGYQGGLESSVQDVDTGVERDRLAKLLHRLTELPEGFQLNRKLKRGLEARRRMAAGEQPLDWATGEALAFATLATEGLRVRMSGQDTVRGTFSHRHAVFYDTNDGTPYMPLANLAQDQAPVEIHNSPLSEAGVLGFEYGYSLDCPDGLVAWEAQFGDFINAAQVIIDQFLCSAEEKWSRLSGITLLLPHGFEGQGPEHSSARLERFLNLAARDNIQVTNPTTPAQLFHLLRRQVLRRWRKPLVVMTPKSLLRHREAVSPLEELTEGTFHRVIGDDDVDGSKDVERILLCTGKIYYELIDRRRELQRDDVAIVRMEQLYPFPTEHLQRVLARYADGTQVIWVQEEPRNMGAWPYLWSRLGGELFERLPFRAVSRPESASPATGSHAAHKYEQQRLITEAFAGVAPTPEL